ncbi:phage tail protein [Vibrio cyclitrophicus]
MTNTTDKSILTAAGKALLAQLNAEEKPLVIDKMIFANVPNRPEFPQPDDVVPSDDVVHEAAVEQRGRLSVDSVIYSTTLTSQEGPFEFNWTGAYCSEYGVLVTIDHHALTPKSADEPGVAGNTLVRSVVLEYKDIAEITNITVDASTWQYNATPRMKKMDDDVAQAIIDQNGKDWFIEDGFLVTPQASAFNIKAGAGYVSGNRVMLEFDRNVQVPNKPSFIYVDAHREGTSTGEQVTLFDFVVTAEEKDDYTDANGVKHFVCKIAQVLVDGSVSDLRPKGESASKEWVQKDAKISVLANAIKRTLGDKASDVLSVKDFGGAPDEEVDTPLDNTDAINLAILTASTMLIKGAEIRFTPGTWRYRYITPRTGVTLAGGAAGSVYLKCISSGEDAPDLGLLSSIRKEDDGNRVYRFGMKRLMIGPEDSGVAAAQDNHQTLIGLNLAGCERGNFEDLTFMACGAGAIVLARCEGGAEGLGFTNTVQDGNYNTFKNISIASCGKYNPEQAAIWLKYKANSNKFYGVFGKPVVNLYGITHGNDNQIYGGTAETSQSIAVFGEMAMGNGFFGIRAENLSGDGFIFRKGSKNNIVIGGWMTGVDGQNFNYDDAPNQVIISSGEYYFGGEAFPPDSSVSRDHELNNMVVRALTSLDDDGRIFIKTKDYYDGKPLRVVLWGSSTPSVSAGDPGPCVEFWSADTSTSEQPLQAKIQAVYNGSQGGFYLDFFVGVGGNAQPEMVMRLDPSNKTIVAPGLPQGNGTPPPGLPDGAFWVDTAAGNVLKVKV